MADTDDTSPTVDTPTDAPTAAPDTGDNKASPQRNGIVVRAIATFTIISFIGLWSYVLYLAFVEGRQEPPDRISDPAFAVAAEERCDTALTDVDDLPVATESPTPEHRGDVVTQANTIYADMLDDLDEMREELIPDSGDQDITAQWLDDWHIFLDDRTRHADRLLDGEDSRLLISAKADEGRHITGWIDEFALANRMDSCVSPEDA